MWNFVSFSFFVIKLRNEIMPELPCIYSDWQFLFITKLIQFRGEEESREREKERGGEEARNRVEKRQKRE